MATPSVSVVVKLVLKEFNRGKKQFEKSLNEIAGSAEKSAFRTRKVFLEANYAFTEFANTSKVVQQAMRDLKAGFIKERDLRWIDALQKKFLDLGEGATINADKFDDLISRGSKIGDAFDSAATSATSLGSSLGTLAVVASTVTTVIGLGIKYIKDSVNAYEDLGREVRRVQLELGVSAQEASAWVEVSKRAGVSTSTFNRMMTQLSRNIVNYRIDQLAGQESTNNFAKALSVLNIELEKADGTTKSASEVFAELQQRVQETGPGTAALAEISNALGFSARQLVEVLYDEALSLKNVQNEAFFLGTILTELDKKQTRELTDATNDLRAAQEGLGNTISRITDPAIEALTRKQASATTTFRFAVAAIKGFIDTQLELIGVSHTMEEYQETLRRNIAKYAFGIDEAAEKEGALARERADHANELLILIEAERRLAVEREKTLDQLDELGVRLGQREDDIRTRYGRALDDIGTKTARRRIDQNIKLSNSLEDIYVKRGIRLRELEFKWQNNVVDLERKFQDKIEDFQTDAARAREKLAVKHRENLFKIQNRYDDSIEEAARKNDTVAVLRAIRTRNRQLRDETRRYSVEQDELDKDLKLKRDKISKDAERQKRDRQKRDADEKAAIERKFRDEIDALSRKNTREIALNRLHDAQRRADANQSQVRAFEDAQTWYRRQEALLRQHLNSMAGMYETHINRMFGGTGRPIAGAPGFTTGTPALGSGTGILYDWQRATSPVYRQHGGVDVVSKPTTFVAGEAGAEIAAFVPLSQSRNINHNFGKLPIDFQGLPGGMDTGAVEAIVYSAMVELARTLSGTRR